MKLIKTHFWILIFTPWILIASLFVAPFISNLLGVEGMYHQNVLLPTFFLPLCVAYPLIKRDVSVKPYPLKPLSGHSLIWTLIMTLSFLSIFILLNLVSDIPMRALQSFAGYPLWLPVVSLGIFGILEVFFYQGVLYSDYRSRHISIWHTAIITGIFATLVHMHPPQFMVVMLIQKVLWVFIIYWTKSLWSPILMNILIFPVMTAFFFEIVTTENQALFQIIFGVLSLISIVMIPLGLKNMKTRYERLNKNEIENASQKSSTSPFNWLFWVLTVFWVGLYIYQYLVLTIRP